MEIIEIKGWAEFSELAVSFTTGKWIYRGVVQTNYELIPKVARKRSKELKFTIRDEDLALERFKRAARPHLAFDPITRLAWMSVAQHHGLPTRLLDWSESPFIALYFAVREGIGRTGFLPVPFFKKPGGAELFHEFLQIAVDELTQVGSEDSLPIGTVKYTPTTAVGLNYAQAVAVYAVPAPDEVSSDVEYGDYSTLSPTDVRLYHPIHLTPRITAQRGVLTLHPNPIVPWEPESGQKWIVQPDLIFKLKKNLDITGINQAALFPDLDGISEHYAWQYWRGM